MLRNAGCNFNLLSPVCVGKESPHPNDVLACFDLCICLGHGDKQLPRAAVCLAPGFWPPWSSEP